MTEQEQIDKFIAERGVTHCPDAFATVVQQPPVPWPAKTGALQRNRTRRQVKRDWAFGGLPQFKA